MSHTVKGILLLSVLLFGFSSCSTSQNASDSSASSIYPAWYSPAGFSSDSTAFHGFATAISSDSVIAVANAELQARINLESALANKLEDVRDELEDDGMEWVMEKEFILTLRNAHQKVEEAATESAGSANAENGYFTGYSKVTISKLDFAALMESAFSGNSSYWQRFSSTSVYTEEIMGAL